MKKRIGIIGTLALVALAAVAVPLLHAQPRHFRGHGGPDGAWFGGGLGMLGGHLRELREELDLSDAQVEQIHTIFRQAHEQNAPFREQLHGTFMSAADVLLANPSDLAGAQAVLDRQATAERTLRANLLAATSKALAVLTPEQRTKLAAKIDEHQRRLQQRRNARR